MKFTLLFIFFALSSSSLWATNIHFSPEIKMGPYYSSGLSGAGFQFGVPDKFDLDAIYLSYTHTSAEFIGIDKDRLKTYRLGLQYELLTKPKVSVQFEAGLIDYEGSRKNIWNNELSYLSGKGISSAAALVIFINKNVGFRVGLDINYIDKNNTFLSYPIATTYSSGIVLQF